MGRIERIKAILDGQVADMVALGRPLLADPDLLAKWQAKKQTDVTYCGYCLQGCLHRVKNGEPLGCNLNPEIGQPALAMTAKPLNVVVAGGGPAGMSAAVYLTRRGHRVTLFEKKPELGGQFNLAWQAPGKKLMQAGLESLASAVRADVAVVATGEVCDQARLAQIKPDLLVWATGAVQNIPDITGLAEQYNMTSIEYFEQAKPVQGPRVLVIGAGRSGLEIAEKLGKEGYIVTATKRTDPIGSMMEMITKKLTLMRLGQMENVTLMPHTTVKQFSADHVVVDQEGEKVELAPFQTVILASGMQSASGPDADIQQAAPAIETIGDAAKVMDIYTAVHAGYELARKY
jgi:NADPH-dependent 2,4-dienoyl-CoA reductase/sulfur reductase-like enzyme